MKSSATSVDRSDRLVAAVVLLVLVAVTGALPAQDRSAPGFHRALEVERVLPQSSVYDMLEDRTGFLWFGTREGVVRWDGYQVRTWKHDPFDAASLPGNVIRALLEDRFGNIWVLAHSYLDRPVGPARIAGPDYRAVERYRADGQVLLDETAAPILVTADSMLLYDSATARFERGFARASPDSAHASAIRWLVSGTTGADGAVWVYSPGRRLERCEISSRRCRIVQLPDGHARTGGRIRRAADGAVLVPSGSHVFAWRDGAFSRLATLPDGDIATDLAAGADGILWVLGQRGVSRIARGSSDRSALPTLAGEANPAPVSILADRAGTVWVGTVWGLYRHYSTATVFGHLEHDPQNPRSPSAGLVVSLTEDRDGAVWIGTIGGGLNRWDRKTGEVRRFRSDLSRPTSLSNDVVWALAAREGIVWAGTAWGLNRIEIGNDRVERLFRVPVPQTYPLAGSVNAVSDLAFDDAGRLWLACGIYCGDSLFYYDPGRAAFGSLAVPDVSHPSYLHYVAPSTLWIGALSGIHRLDIDKRVLTQLPEDTRRNLDGILAFLPARDGGLWVGTNSGLYRFDPTGRFLVRYSESDGLPGNAVFGLLQDGRGRIWISTNRGLAMVEPESGGSIMVRTYDRDNGLGNVEFNRNAALATRDGLFLFGGDQGLTYFDPETIEPNQYRPPVVITSARRSTQRGTRVATYLGDGPLRIAPDDYTFSFEFAALNYRYPYRNRYQVMLEGFDVEWRSQGTERRTTYTNVPPGRYRFLVRGSNDDGLWSPEPAALAVIVEPALWETAWFRLVMGLSAVGLIALATWYVSRSKYRLQIESARAQHALELERTRISRDMHDEVGASLTEITILSELAQADGQDGNRLERIGQKSRATLASIGEIVWAIDPRNDDGDRFVAYLREYVADFVEAAALEATLEFPAPGALAAAGADFRRTVLMIVKEALTNVAKHAGARQVSVALTVNRSLLRLEIADDGRGIAAVGRSGADGGNGLRNMRSRAEESGGLVVIDSSAGQGTRIVLELPVAPARLPDRRES